MARTYKERMDPDGETELLAEGMGALASGPIGFVLKRLGVDPSALEGARETREQYRELVEAPERVARHLAPLGWIVFGGAMHDEYQRAAELAEAGDPEAAEKLLVDAWNEHDRFRWLLKRVLSLYRGTPLRDDIGHGRWSLIDEALKNHEDQRYSSAIALALTQIDGIVYDHTGRDAKSFFATGAKAQHLEDEETLAGHPEGVKVLARLTSRDRKESTTQGELIRHGIIHGRELGFGTKANSTKALVCLCAVIEKMKPLADAESERLFREREERYAGSNERDEFGRLLDRRGFKLAQETLERLASYEFGHFKRQGRYSEALDDLDPGGKRLIGECLVLEVAAGGGSYRAWLPTPTGVHFGIAGRGGEWVTWRYQGAGPPPDDLDDADAWRFESEAFHPDW